MPVGSCRDLAALLQAVAEPSPERSSARACCRATHPQRCQPGELGVRLMALWLGGRASEEGHERTAI
eukprot:11155555-Lingulodinium_polyedra.AAC.1